jgi:hypothetical protein
MAYIGNTPTSNPFVVDTYSGTGSQTVFTGLTFAPAGTAAIAVFVNGSYTAPSDYLLSGTTITFNTAPSAGSSNIRILHLGVGATSSVPTDGSVTTQKLGSNLTLSGGTTSNGNLTFTGTGRRILGDFSNSTIANRVMFQTSTVNSGTNVSLIPNGTVGAGSGSAHIRFEDNTSIATDNGSFGQVLMVQDNDFRIGSNRTGTGSYLPMAFYTGGSERVRIDTSGNVGIGTSSPSSVISGVATVLQVQNGNLAALALNNSTAKKFSISSQVSSSLVFYDETASAERVRIDSSGNLLVGITTPIHSMRVRAHGGYASTGTGQFNIDSNVTDFEWVLRTGQRQLFYVNNASVVASLSATGVWTNASDARYKENIRPITYGLAEVMQLQPRAYNVIGSNKEEIGFVAQEVEPLLPELVDSTHNSVTDEDRLTLSYGQMSAVLVKAIQELKAELDTVKAELAALKGAK